jgi:hypothetical protein
MAKYFVPLDSFAQVEALYNETRPIRVKDKSKRGENMNKDIRPTNDRGRKWERVVKISDTKYAVTDSEQIWGYLDMDFQPNDVSEADFLSVVEQLSPIVWERKRGGKEVLTVRNTSDWGRYASLPTSRVDFLYRHLPRGWGAWSGNGHQFVSAGNRQVGYELGKYVLPRNTFMPKQMFDSIQREHDRAEVYYSYAQNKDDMALVFTKDKHGKWSVPKKTYGEKKWRVSIKAKKRMKPMLDKFYDTAIPMMAMIGSVSLYQDDDIREFFSSATGEPAEHKWLLHSFVSGMQGYSEALPDAQKKMLVDIMKDPQHPNYLGFIKILVNYANDRGYNTTPDFRAATNRWVNNAFGLRKKVEIK